MHTGGVTRAMATAKPMQLRELLAPLSGRLTGIDWAARLKGATLALPAPPAFATPPPGPPPRRPKAAPLPQAPIDPYFVWFDSSIQGEAGRVDLLIEMNDQCRSADGDFAARRWLFDLGFRAHLEPGPHAWKSAFVGGDFPLGRIRDLDAELACRVQVPRILRYELASPRFQAGQDVVAAGDAPHAADSGGTTGAVRASNDQRAQAIRQAQSRLLADSRAMNAAAEQLRRNQQVAPCAELPHADPLVVVVDDFCNFASRVADQRVTSIWHQGRSPSSAAEPPPTAPEIPRPVAPPADGSGNDDGEDSFWDQAGDYDRMIALRAEGLKSTQELCAATRSEASSNGWPFSSYYGARLKMQKVKGSEEGEIYRRTGLARRRSMHWSHASAVLFLLLGTDRGVPGANPDGVLHCRVPDDLHFVQLPDATVEDTSGGSLAIFALDAIHHAVSSAVHTGRSHVIVNLSYGTNGGPHDGSSMFERAILELLDQYDGSVYSPDGRRLPTLHIVLPAGNSQLWRCHASRWLHGRGTTTELDWKILPDDESDSFLELWFSAGSKLQIEFVSPHGHTLWVDPDHRSDVWSDCVDDGSGHQVDVLHAALIYPAINARSDTADGALIAVAPTRRRAGFGRGDRYLGRLERVPMEAPAGAWTVRITNLGVEPVNIHAWVQRDDSAPGRLRGGRGYLGRQSHLIDDCQTPADPRFTSNGIASAFHAEGRLWVIGAIDERGRMSRYSAAGPDREFGDRLSAADVATVVDRSENVRGRHVGGVLSGSRVRLAGTSIAAAAFSRMLYDTLARGGTMAWCNGGAAPAPRPPVAGEPEMADDFLRGSYSRLKSVDDIAPPPLKR